MENSATLLLYCQDRKGLVFVISRFLLQHGANILHADQHNDAELGLFFIRIQWSLAGFDLDQQGFDRVFAPLATGYGFTWRVFMEKKRPAVAIFVSRYQHCLVDLLYRHQIGELPCELAMMISNHEDALGLAKFYNVPFYHTAVNPKDKTAAEGEQVRLLKEHRVELIVLARYMQILSPDLVSRYPRRIINVHHSFLPAFVGAKPYHAAFARGVKLIGATSHYATQVLDEGPIIEQDVTRISHRDRVEDLIAKGRDLERVVLSRAVRWHLEQRILCYGNKTVVFD
jgi:formyltetrahydrofolate deformylase